jgi:hypothetical protein
MLAKPPDKLVSAELIFEVTAVTTSRSSWFARERFRQAWSCCQKDAPRT